MPKLTSAAWLTGWLSTTAGAVALDLGHSAWAICLISAGLLLLGLGGYRWLGVLLWFGLEEAIDAASPEDVAKTKRDAAVRRRIMRRALPRGVTAQ